MQHVLLVVDGRGYLDVSPLIDVWSTFPIEWVDIRHSSKGGTLHEWPDDGILVEDK